MDASNLPIDIHLSKLTDWLITRRICPREWIRRVEPLRTRSQALLEQLLADSQLHDEGQTLACLPQIHYFALRQASDRIRAKCGDEKTLFGSYKNPHVNEIMSILKEYEKEHVYLAEAAQILYRCVIYEGPALVKDVTKHDQTLGSLQWNMRAWCNRSRATRDKFTAECREYEIEMLNSEAAAGDGDATNSIERQLREHLANLPPKFDEIALKVKDLDELTNVYEQFLQVTTGQNASGKPDKRPLPVLRHLIKHGNASVHEAAHLLTAVPAYDDAEEASAGAEASNASVPPSYSRQTSMSTCVGGHTGNQVVDEAEKRAFGTKRCASFLYSPSLLGKDLLVSEAAASTNGGLSRHVSTASMIVNVNDETISDRMNELKSEAGNSDTAMRSTSGSIEGSEVANDSLAGDYAFPSGSSASSGVVMLAPGHPNLVGRANSTTSKRSINENNSDVNSSSGVIDADTSSVLTDETASSAGDERGGAGAASNSGSAGASRGGVEIDFSSLDDTTLSTAPTDAGGDLHMDVDITIEESGTTKVGDATDIEGDVTNISFDGGSAEDSTLLGNRALRGVLIDELYELRSFVAQRLAECAQQNSSGGGGGSDDMLFGHLLSSDAYQKACNSSWLNDQKGRVEAVLRMLADSKLQILLQTKESPSYPARVTEQLSEMVQLADRQMNRALGVEQQGRQLQKEQDSLLGQFDRNLRFARELQTAIEADISSRYDKRRVNIMSGVQSLHKPAPSGHAFSVEACMNESAGKGGGGGKHAAKQQDAGSNRRSGDAAPSVA